LGVADHDGTPDDDIRSKPSLDAFNALTKAGRVRKSHGESPQGEK
jgi:hypothetical protein